MSRHKEVTSLSSLCLQNIAENMQSLWLQDYTEKYMEDYNFLYIEGPFNQLAGSLVQELLRILGESHKLNKGCLHLLLQPHLTALSLRSCSGLVNVAIMQLVSVRCKHLTLLDLHSCNRVPPPSLVSLVEGLPRLVKLCLSDTQCDSQVLSVIGRRCPRLSELDLSRCKKLSAASLLSLVYDARSSTFCCQALRVLLLDAVSPKGSSEQWAHVLCFILLALPFLEQLSNPSLPSALHLLRGDTVGQSSISFHGFPSLGQLAQIRALRESKSNAVTNGNTHRPNTMASPASAELKTSPERVTLRLRKLDELEEEDVSLLGPLFPAVEEVAISLSSQPVGSWSLVQWAKLKQLTLHCPEQPDRTLEEFLSTIHVVGKSLRVLSMQNLLLGQQDSLSSLLTLCPNLQSFHSHLSVATPTITPNHAEFPPWPGDPLPLPRLQTFSLLMEGEGATHPVFLHKLGGLLVSVLKGCPRLESLSLCGVPAPLDSVFEVVYASTHSLQRLSAVSLCNSNVTQWGASLILRSRSDLRSLDLSHCREVTCRDYQQLQKRALKDKRNVTITWK